MADNFFDRPGPSAADMAAMLQQQDSQRRQSIVEMTDINPQSQHLERAARSRVSKSRTRIRSAVGMRDKASHLNDVGKIFGF